MFTSTFTFSPGDFTEEFHRLDQRIAEVAKSIPGYLGEEAWENPSTGLVSNVYYWESMDALMQLVHHPSHQIAKARQDEWLKGYQVVIAEVLRTYGDHRMAHPLQGK